MELDKTESEMVKRLMKDGRISFRKLAEKLDVSTPTISSKVSKLEDMGVIQGYSADIDGRKLGFHTYVFRLTSGMDKSDEVTEELSNLDEVGRLFKTSSQDLLLLVYLRDLQGLDTFLERIQKMDEIQDIEYDKVTEEVEIDFTLPIYPDISLDVGCYYCHKPIEGEPVKLELEGREHYLCCETCAEQYRERYEQLKESSDV